MDVDLNSKPGSLAEPMPRSLTRLREAAGQLTGSVFFGTLLRSMRNSALHGPYGHGGRGEEVFSEQLHGLLAQRLGESMRNNLGDLLYKHLERQQRALIAGRSRDVEGT